MKLSRKSAEQVPPSTLQLRHTGFGKSVWGCSEAMLIVACAGVLVNGGGATEGGTLVAQFGGLPVRGNKGQTERRMAGE
jgi:hypothetical protein